MEALGRSEGGVEERRGDIRTNVVMEAVEDGEGLKRQRVQRNTTVLEEGLTNVSLMNTNSHGYNYTGRTGAPSGDPISDDPSC